MAIIGRELELEKRNFLHKKVDIPELVIKFHKERRNYVKNNEIEYVKIRQVLFNEQAYKSKISLDTSKKIAHDFYYFINSSFGKKYELILNGENGLTVDIGIDKFGRNVSESNLYIPFDLDESCYCHYLLSVKNYNSIKTVYSLVHEVMHTMMLIDKKYKKSSFILLETPSYLVESLLGDFIINNYKKYNLNDLDIIYDVCIWNINRFYNYINNINNSVIPDYFIALLIRSKFDLFSLDIKKEKLVEFVSYLKTDKLENAIKIIELNLDCNEIENRNLYINYMIQNFISFSQTLLEINKKTKIKKIN